MFCPFGPDPYTNHFTQADSIIPGAGNPQAWNRYAYVFNNPLRYTDPSGHEPKGPGSCYDYVNGGCGYLAYSQIETSKQKNTDWLIVCGIYYTCTGDQTGTNSVFGLPAYPGWQQTIEAIEGNNVTFIPVPEPQSNYLVSAYAAVVAVAIQTSQADEINLICHSRGGQVCTHLANVIKDSRIKTFFLLDPSFRLDEDKRDGVNDTFSDYQTVINNGQYEIVLIVSASEYIPAGSSSVPTYAVSFGTNDDGHNKMVFEPGDISQVLKAILNHILK